MQIIKLIQIVKYPMEQLNFYGNVFLKYLIRIEYMFVIYVDWLQ